MKHIKSFEDHNKVDEAFIPGGEADTFRNAVKGILQLPLQLLAMVITNLIRPTKLDKQNKIGRAHV